MQLHRKKTFYDGGNSPKDGPWEPLYLAPYLWQGQLDQGTSLYYVRSNGLSLTSVLCAGQLRRLKPCWPTEQVEAADLCQC